MTVKTLQLYRQGTLTNEQNRPFQKLFLFFCEDNTGAPNENIVQNH